MKKILPSCLLALCASCAADSYETSSEIASPTTPASESAMSLEQASETTSAGGLYSLPATSLDGAESGLAAYEGKVTLVVNVASRCGYTKQYAGLQKLHDELSSQGFSVLGFPSNEFGGQEPGSAEEIQKFCTNEFGVTFPMFAKSEVKAGDTQSPVYSFLQQQTDKVPGWNFCKYLVGKDGQVIAFYPSGVTPDASELRKAIDLAIG
ncbi:MAG: glutathione peroxidase [Planctomycetota bacterium]|jgi:glutathione peroxidase|nr:glutathione peroxidase [Planctomycetota bacterium]